MPKYVIVEGGYPILFPEELTHKEVYPAKRKTSAGFYSVKEGKVIVFGESSSLKLRSLPEDAVLIEALLSGLSTLDIFNLAWMAQSELMRRMDK